MKQTAESEQKKGKVIMVYPSVEERKLIERGAKRERRSLTSYLIGCAIEFEKGKS
jgi:uncharacterized protein (DUF1778 family)